MKVINSFIPHGGKDNIPTRIVVHAMGEFIMGADGISTHAVAFLNNYGYSAHVLVAPNGTQYVCRSDSETAWHARSFNKNSLGIEFLVKGSHNYESFLNRIREPYVESDQLDSGVDVVKNWINLHDIKSIDKHSTLSPDRKVDPGIGFPWDIFLTKLRD